MINFFVTLAFFTMASIPLFSQQLEIDAPTQIDISLTFADTPEKRVWGLMGKTSLEENEGMLFPYDPPRIASMWMFNVHFDLSIAFIDAKGFIQEVKPAPAYPEMLKPQHKISNVYELQKLTFDDPVVRFFAEHTVSSKRPVHYALEMNAEWFSRHEVQIGDKLIQPQNENKPYTIQRSINLGTLLTKAPNATKIVLKSPSSLAVWLPEKQPTTSLSFYDTDEKKIENTVLTEGSGYYLSKKVKYFVFDKLRS